MDRIRNKYVDRMMVKIEMEAAEALAGLAHFQSTTATLVQEEEEEDLKQVKLIVSQFSQ